VSQAGGQLGGEPRRLSHPINKIGWQATGFVGGVLASTRLRRYFAGTLFARGAA
jgi:hypothetical protein